MKHIEDTPWWICDIEDTNYVAYSDTDSIYIHAEPLLRHLYPSFDEMPSEEKDDKLDNKFKNYKPTAFYLYPRSSISKTNFRLANNVGIIDSGYRGNIGAYFDCKCNTKIVKNQRLLQICSNTLEPFYVVLVDNLNITERGKNGFGSSGL